MRQKDVEISVEEVSRMVAIFIYRPKTDQRNKGCLRALEETGESISPVRSMLTYLNAIGWDCDSDEKLFSDEVGKRVRSAIKWSASPNGLGPGRFSTHSLRIK